ncbi:MAG: asparagine synthase (glutamine-hydrolyzing) [Deltaproteobacteria bacterium]|nr:asparagine synthase (glutamine-hydrolyzing) [Deltaproteobacteria bacterium]
MCGICGIVSTTPIENGDRLLSTMADTMRHRGPDDNGIFLSPRRHVGLAHQRLAIVDLSPAGHQPMSDSSGHLTIVFNGEIYNHQDLRGELEGCGHSFRSRCDTEVILVAYREWGVDCLDRLNGMFAFALYDAEQNRVFVARDRAGEKPFFYFFGNGKFVFASELKALLADPALPRDLDVQSFDHYLAYGYVGGDRSMLRGIKKLPQGHAAIYDIENASLRVWRYWNLPASNPSAKYTADELLERTESLLADSIRRRLVADVPVSILLSGGVDSSLLVALAARHSSKLVKSFTARFTGHPRFDEGPYARIVAEHFETDHTELEVGPCEVPFLETLARQYDEPIADHAIVPTALISRLVSQHCKVVLGGDGGDELFGGYPQYNRVQIAEQLRRFAPVGVLDRIAEISRRLTPLGTRGRNFLVGLAGGLRESLVHNNLYFDRASRDDLSPLLGSRKSSFVRAEEALATHVEPALSALQQATRLDFRSLLVDDYLVKVDRATMLYSLEYRAPFLDHRLVEFAFRDLPDPFRATTWKRKILLRQLAGRHLPPSLDLTRKQGFTMPLGEWLKGDWGDFFTSVLAEADPNVFEPRAIQRLLKGQRRGRSNAHRVFALTMFELWRRQYGIRIPARLLFAGDS